LTFFYSSFTVKITSNGISFDNSLIIWNWPSGSGHNSLFNRVSGAVEQHFGKVVLLNEEETSLKIA